MNTLNPTAKPNLRSALRFALSGILATALHVTIAVAILESALSTQSTANGIAFATATLFSYTLNTLWSFSKPMHRKNLARFTVVALIGLILSMAVATIAQYADLPYIYGIGAVVSIVPPITFLLHRSWTYK